MFRVEEIIPFNLPRRQKTLLVGIDGCGGAGKSTLAQRIRENLENVSIVQTDDFYDKDHFDLRRLKKQVLEPLSKNMAAKYQHFDWDTQKLTGWQKVETGGIIIVEGVCSIHSKIADFYDYKIWVDCPREIRLTRGIERDGEQMRDIWEDEWMPAEDFYMTNDFPRERADLIIEGFNS